MTRTLTMRRLALASASFCLLTACSSILPARAPAPDLYQLSPVSLPEARKAIPAQIVVETPLATRGLDTDRIVVRENANEVKYLSDVRWADRMPRLVQSALIQGLESAGSFSGVGRPEDGLRSTYALLTDLRAFDIVSDNGTHVQITIAAKLVRSPGGEVIASKLFNQEIATKGGSNGAAVGAFDEGVKALTTDMTGWITENARTSPPKAQPSASAEPVVPEMTQAAAVATTP